MSKNECLNHTFELMAKVMQQKYRLALLLSPPLFARYLGPPSMLGRNPARVVGDGTAPHAVEGFGQSIINLVKI